MIVSHWWLLGHFQNSWLLTMYKGRLWPRSWASAIISIIMKTVQCFECAKKQQHINCVRPVHKCYLEEHSNSRLLALVLQIRGDWCLVSADSFAKTVANTSSSRLRFIALLELGLMKPSTVWVHTRRASARPVCTDKSADIAGNLSGSWIALLVLGLVHPSTFIDAHETNSLQTRVVWTHIYTDSVFLSKA